MRFMSSSLRRLLLGVAFVAAACGVDQGPRGVTSNDDARDPEGPPGVSTGGGRSEAPGDGGRVGIGGEGPLAGSSGGPPDIDAPEDPPPEPYNGPLEALAGHYDVDYEVLVLPDGCEAPAEENRNVPTSSLRTESPSQNVSTIAVHRSSDRRS